MAVLTQTVPTFDSVVAGLSGAYTTQLAMSGATGAVDFAVASQSSALLVSTAGVVTTTGTLEAGTYVVSGTATDSLNNSGPFTFTLAVLAPLSPQTSVTPITPVAPTGQEIKVPVEIDSATGAFSFVDTFYDVVAQHLQSIIMTVAGERVMEPGYGAGLPNAVFAPDSTLEMGLISEEIRRQVKAWESEVQIVDFRFLTNPSDPTQLTMQVDYVVQPLGSMNTVTVNVGGSIGQVVGG